MEASQTRSSHFTTVTRLTSKSPHNGYRISVTAEFNCIYDIQVGDIWSEWVDVKTHQAPPLGVQLFQIQPLKGGTQAFLKWDPPSNIRGEYNNEELKHFLSGIRLQTSEVSKRSEQKRIKWER